jgi:t-SNARE complex subunit (syntaxin)
MQEQVVGQAAHSKVKNTVNDIQRKYEAILQLEQSVNELFELFQELAMLI